MSAHLPGGRRGGAWAFDIATYWQLDSTNEFVACEVKKTASELEGLVRTMRQLATDDVRSETSMSKGQINAYRKLNALRTRRAPFFWALGPGGAGYVFRMSYGEDGMVMFSAACEDDLRYGDDRAADAG